MRALISVSLSSSYFDAFSSREPVSTSLENAMSSVSRYRRGKGRHVALRTLVHDLLALDHVKHGFGNISCVVADPFDVLGAAHQVNTERDVARIFHHVGQELAEQRSADGVDFLVALPHRHRRRQV